MCLSPAFAPAPKTAPAHLSPVLQDGEKYEPHHDYFSFPDRDKNGGNRMATVLMYLTGG